MKTPCVEHSGSKNTRGYGLIGQRLAHRVVWESEHGPIPEGLCVLHHCDNPPCIRLSHLFLGTKGDNNRDRTEKRRHHNQQKTCCPKCGGPFSFYKNGKRYCRPCKNEQSAEYKRATYDREANTARLRSYREGKRLSSVTLKGA